MTFFVKPRTCPKTLEVMRLPLRKECGAEGKIQRKKEVEHEMA
jgi:hypothetical protein